MKKLFKTIGFGALILLLVTVGLMMLWPQLPILKIMGFGALILLLIMIGFVGLRPKFPPPPASIETVGELDAYLGTLVNHNTGSPPGLSLTVVKAGNIVYQNAFGLADAPNKIPATPQTVYNQWSLTKVFTAVAILQLQEKNRLLIDDPVVKYLAFFDVQYPSADSEAITIRHLLTHSSGLPNNTPEVVGWVHTDGDPAWNQTELLQTKLPAYAELKFEPGQHVAYTNIGYMVLAAIIEETSGQAYEDYVVENILVPLGMNLTNFIYTAAMEGYAAAGAHPQWDMFTPLLPFLIDNLDELVREKTDGVIWFNHVYSDQNGPTGLIGPPTDTARFLMAFLNNGKLDGQQILTPESIDMMLNDFHSQMRENPENTKPDEPYQGLGWLIVPYSDGTYHLEHSGGGPGFAVDMRVYPDKALGMVIMANGTYLPSREIFDLMAGLKW